MARRGLSFVIVASPMFLALAAADGTHAAESGAAAQIAIGASVEQRQQIVDAMEASPLLSQHLGALAARGVLTAIDVVEPTARTARPGEAVAAADPVKGPFAAALDGSRIVLSSTLLPILRVARLTDVARPDDVLPNQMVFVLAHLADHLERPVSRTPRAGEDLEAYGTRMTEREARAFIAAWNATVDEAVHRRGDASLGPDQVASLLVNCRYRFALLGRRDAHIAAPSLSASGMIDPTPSNIDAVAKTLQRSAISDLE